LVALPQSEKHQSFEWLEIAHDRLVQGNNYYVHYFIPTEPEHFRLHGKILPPDRFSKFYDPPDPRLIAWHYSQTVKSRIRGYSVGMNTTDKR
jgi:hypothetical protein